MKNIVLILTLMLPKTANAIACIQNGSSFHEIALYGGLFFIAFSLLMFLKRFGANSPFKWVGLLMGFSMVVLSQVIESAAVDCSGCVL